MPLDNYYTGVLPPHIILPLTGLTGVVPPRRIPLGPAVVPPAQLSPGTITLPHNPPGIPDRGLPAFAELGDEVNNTIKAAVFPPTRPGDGLISQTDAKIAALDVVNGMDRVMGKTQTITQKGWIGQHSKNLRFTSHEVLGPLSGRLGRMFDGVA